MGPNEQRLSQVADADPGEVRRAADRWRALADTLDDVAAELRGDVRNGIEQSWTGEASQAATTAFGGLADEIEVRATNARVTASELDQAASALATARTELRSLPAVPPAPSAADYDLTDPQQEATFLRAHGQHLAAQSERERQAGAAFTALESSLQDSQERIGAQVAQDWDDTFDGDTATVPGGSGPRPTAASGYAAAGGGAVLGGAPGRGATIVTTPSGGGYAAAGRGTAGGGTAGGGTGTSGPWVHADGGADGAAGGYAPAGGPGGAGGLPGGSVPPWAGGGSASEPGPDAGSGQGGGIGAGTVGGVVGGGLGMAAAAGLGRTLRGGTGGLVAGGVVAPGATARGGTGGASGTGASGAARGTAAGSRGVVVAPGAVGGATAGGGQSGARSGSGSGASSGSAARGAGAAGSRAAGADGSRADGSRGAGARGVAPVVGAAGARGRDRDSGERADVLAVEEDWFGEDETSPEVLR